jgi:agmatinase
VVGFDIVELCPNEKDKSSDFLAAKLYYKMLSYKFAMRNDLDEFEEEDAAKLKSAGVGHKFDEDDE